MSTSPHAAPDHELTWDLIKEYVRSGTLVPVIGPGVITFGENDTPLYPWLLEELTREYDISPAPASLHELVCFVKLNRPRVDEDTVRAKLAQKIRGLKEGPGPLLRAVASLPNCETFFTLGCDPLFEQALTEASGRSVQTWNSFKAGDDLPLPGSRGPVLGYLFGKVSSLPESFHLWDADAIEFAFDLQKLRTNSRFQRLNHTLAEKDLLFIGAEMSDWALRFLLRIIQNDKLSKQTERFLFLAEKMVGQTETATAFFDSVSKRIHFRHDDPITFARKLCEEASSMAVSRSAPVETAVATFEPTPSKGSVFISYEHTDREAAIRIARTLQSGGCKVWLDVGGGLRGGDDYAYRLKKAVKNCGFFVSVVSRASEARMDRGYFIKERNWAAQCYEEMARSRKYYYPVIIDDTPTRPLHNEPPEFEHVHVIKAPDGELPDSVVAELAAEQLKLFPNEDT